MIFNPSFPYRLVHTVIAAYLTTALVVGACGAWHLLKDGGNAHHRKMFSMAMWMAALVAPIQIFAGDAHGLNTLEHQPAKVMAMEGISTPPERRAADPVRPAQQHRGKVHYAVEIPKAASLILKHDPNAPLPGLKDFPRDQGRRCRSCSGRSA